MKSMFKQVAAVAAGFMVMTQSAWADVGTRPLPEPGTIALVGLGIAAAIVVAKRRK